MLMCQDYYSTEVLKNSKKTIFVEIWNIFLPFNHYLCAIELLKTT